MTPQQIQLIKLAQRRLNLTDAQYRMILKNVADVSSSKALTNTTFEDVMALFEERGFRMPGKPDDHFRNKVKLRGTFAGERIAHKIHALVAGTPYTLPGLCDRFSHGRTREVTKLDPHESYNLVEMLKKVHERSQQSEVSSQPGLRPLTADLSLFPTHPVTEDTAHAPAKVARIYEIPALAPQVALDEAGREDVPF